MRTQNIHFQDKIRDLELIPNKSISAVMEKKNISRDSRTSSAVTEKNISRDSRTSSAVMEKKHF